LDDEKMTVAVTGGSGHLGGNLVRALLAQGREVRALMREDTRAVDGLPIQLVRGDVRDEKSLHKAFRGVEIVFHLAARISVIGEEGGLVRETNVQGVANVASACLACGVKRLIHVSSIHARDQAPLDEPLDETRSPAERKEYPAYDRSKAAGEKKILEAVEKGLDAVLVCPTAILGPYDFKPSRMGQVLLDLHHRRLPALVEGGFDWVDARDVAAGALAAEKLGRSGEKYLLSGHWLSIADLARLVEKNTGVKTPRWTSPMWLARFGAPFALTFSRLTGRTPLFTPESLWALRANKQVCRTKAEKELGYSPRPLEETISDAFRWFSENGRLETKRER
jgi:dihydroflavonol-4-reductase